jgi:hypothetical protein
MAKILSINTDIMGSRLELTRFEEFPKYEEPTAFASCDGSFDLPQYEEPVEFPKYEEPVDFPNYEEPPEFCQVVQSTAIMDINTSPRSPVPLSNKRLDNLVCSPTRKPSPQPTHFSVPPRNGNGNGHRVLRSATVGYIAPEFKGKAAQMLQGRVFLMRLESYSDIL